MSNPSSASSSAAATSLNSRSRKHAELQLVEQGVYLLAIPALPLELLDGEVDLDVGDQLGELPVAQHAGKVLAQGIAGLALDGVDLLGERGEAAVLAHPLGGGLLADARDVGQVVARVAAQGREIGVLGRGQAVLLLHRRRREPGHLADAAARIQHGYAVIDQLQRIAVAGADQHLHAGCFGLLGQGRDDVVGLEVVDCRGSGCAGRRAPCG